MMGKLQMDREWTEQDLRTFAEGAQAAFETVLLDELPQDTGWQDEGLQVSYSLCNGRVSCVLHRTVRADGKLWRITMSAPLAGNLLPEERMSARERELCREDLNHDFLSGVYNRRYLETVIAADLDRWAEQGRKAAVALVSLDHGAQLRDTYGQPVMDQLICFVANQWKKYFDIPGSQIVCRLTGTTFVVGCLDLDGGQLAEQMRNIYAEMPHECITSMGMMKRVPFTLSVAVAGLDELDSAANCWQRLYAICDERLDHGAQLRDTYGQPVMDQLICFVANQWKKYFDIPGSQIVCRLTGTTFVVGCLDLDGGQLAEQMRNIYAEMPHECITSMGMMKRVPFTLSVAVAGLDELDSAANCWQRLYAICDERLRGIQISGGNKIC